MIPAPPGLVARFKRVGEGPKGAYTYFEESRVYAFDDDGTPLIISRESARELVRATQYSDYHGLLESAECDYVALISAGGWRCKTEFTDKNGKRWVSDEPLVAWSLRRDGIVIPLKVDSDGFVYEVRREVIYHPDYSCPEDAESNENFPTH